MHVKSIIIAAPVTALLMAGTPVPAHAASCEVFRPPLAFGSDAKVEMIVRAGTDCRVRYAEDEIFEVDSNEITARPLYGGVRVHGGAGAYYRSNPGYRGRDRFVFTLCGSEGGRQGCSAVRVNVTVR